MKKKLFAAYILLYHFIGFTAAIGGWFWEVLLFFAKDRQFVNRGFLYGPWLPVYGTGAVILSAIFFYKDIHARIIYAYFGTQAYPETFYHGHLHSKLQMSIQQILKQLQKFPAKHVHFYKSQIHNNNSRNSKPPRHKIWHRHFAAYIRIFFICMFGGGFIEYAVGWLLWHVFHQKYWDYTGYLLNIHGYVCLFSALGFGIFGLLGVTWIAPHLIRWWERIRFSIQILIIGLLDVLFVTDIVFSLIQPNTGKNITFSFWI